MEHVGRYEITEPLGQGGMGTVYKAYDPLLARVVAVKVISAQFSSQPDLRERFFREARAVARLDHPNIITVYDLGEQDGLPFLAMQFLEGRDLEHRMRSTESMSLARKAEIALGIAAGLAHAHAAGIVHRDVKPANVFITDDGQVKLLDFGLARLVTSELTRSNVMVGTVNYMAPEQLRGEKTDHRVDIFSFGVVLYELLGGKKPFQAESFASTMYKILEETPEALEHLDPQLPPRLIAVVDRAIAKAREDRYQLMFDLLRDLEGAYELIRGSDHHVVTQIESVLRSHSQGKPKSNPPMTLVDPDAPTIVGRPTDEMELLGATPPPTQQASGPLNPAPPAPARSWRLPVLGAAGIVLALVGVFLLRGRPTPSAPALPAVEEKAPPSAAAPATVVPPSVPQASPTTPVEPQPSTPDPAAQAPAPADDEKQVADRQRAADQQHLRRATASMRAAKASAVTVNAPSVVPELFAAAEKQANGARDASERGMIAAAAARMEAAATLYSNAEASARIQMESRAARQREADAQKAEAQRAADAAALKPTEASPTKVELPRPAPAPAPAPPAAPAAPKPADAAPAADEAHVAREAALVVLRKYTSALERRDMNALKAVWPSLGGREQSAIETDFQNARSISVTFVNPKVDVSGAAATVTGVRQYSLETRDRQALRSETLTTLSLKHVGDDWLIDSVRHQPR